MTGNPEASIGASGKLLFISMRPDKALGKLLHRGVFLIVKPEALKLLVGAHWIALQITAQ